jgi:formylglycine-generating enzyme required for sulfatase activity
LQDKFMARIFISYARKHEAFARKLAGSLSNVGASVWLDVEDIPAGMNWSSAIQEGLDFCDVMLVIIAPESMASKNVGDEWQYYLDEGKVVIPVLLERAKVHFQIRRLQYVDFLAQNYDTAFTQLHSELRRKGVDLKPISADDRNVTLPVKPPLPEREKTEVQEVVPPKPRTRLIIGGIVTVLAVILAIVVLNSGILNSPTVTNTPTPDLNATVAARQTANVEATIAAASPTSSDTPRPTEDTDATINAMIIATDQYFVGLTVTATHLTPLPTATPTPNPLQAALQLAQNFSGGNRDWQPFATIFPNDPTGAEMMLVPAGSFMMGSEDGAGDEQPVHEQVFDAPFWIDRTEVTRAMYAQCVAAGECSATPENQYSTRDTQPINRVTWFQARDFCVWRGARLPTEREWEYAARGPDNWVYPWGDDFVAENAVYGSNSGNVTADVGSKPRGISWVGALDMSGNVWEWVSSIYRPYPYKVDDGRESNGNANSARVLRGGSFYLDFNLRSTYRFWLIPSYVNINWGFRCARSYNSDF